MAICSDTEIRKYNVHESIANVGFQVIFVSTCMYDIFIHDIMHGMINLMRCLPETRLHSL